MSIPTVASLRRARARLDQRRLSAEKIVAIMRKEGQALLCSFERSGPVWRLTNGRAVSLEIAKLVTTSSDVVSVGDSLFCNTSGQTFRVAK
jgi:hypothetical protein